MKSLPLRDLATGLAGEFIIGDGSTQVRDLVYDSRRGQPGDAFVALPSVQLDGHDFIGDAYRRGVRTFVVEHWPGVGNTAEPGVGSTAEPGDAPQDSDLTVWQVPDTRVALAGLSAAYFGHPAEKLTVVGLTGTKGKTTTSYIIKAICDAAGRRTGLIGSNGITYPAPGDPRAEGGVVHFKLMNTTPESYELHRIFAEMADAGVTTVVLEATSQGFMMHRTDGVQFAIGLFTNISHDHISPLEHPSFEHYFACKKRIFDQSDVCVVNRDAQLYDEIVDNVTIPIRTYGLTPGVDYWEQAAEPSQPVLGGPQSFVCQAPGFTEQFAINLLGQFNVSNAMAAIAITDMLGLPVAAMRAGLAAARVPGRLEVLDVPAPYTVMIDFAHNRLSMEAMIDALQSYQPRRILSVFGLEGDRSHERRFDCGEVIGRSMAYTILADASPRFDDPDQILADIAAGIERGGGAGKYEIIRDRRVAIPKILSMAEPGDVVLLVGKGAVTYEEVKGVNYPFDERDVVKEYFQNF